jgi:branched-chain amino acid transport system permease protein
MYLLLFCQQFLNGLQSGVMLFLMASGMTLVFGIMNLINLAHGSLFMVGAYLCATVFQQTGSFLLGLLAALVGTGIVGIAVEVIALRTLYRRDHLDQVLATFGLILFFNELIKIVWGPRALFLDVPAALSGTIEIIPGAPYPAFRLAIIAVGIVIAIFLYLLITRTRLGMLIRASSTMGEDILILTFVVIVIGGIGSIRGAFVGAILVGLIDTLGRAFLPTLFKLFMEPATADGVGASLASMTIYILMALVLALKPRGLLLPHG